MAFNDRFINVMDVPTQPFSVPQDDLGTRALLGIAQFREGPVTLYIGRSAVLRGALDLPERVSVTMAPGAVVRLEPGAFWIIRGDTDLGVERRFDTAAGSRVELLGALDSIHPEWWGPGSSADDALASCIELARARVTAGVPAVPVRLIGSYRVTQPWVIRPPDSSSMQVVVEGMFPKGDGTLTPTLALSRGGIEVIPIVRVERGAGLIARHVAFDTRDRHFVLDPADPPAAVDQAEGCGACTYQRCTFFYTTSCGVRVHATGPGEVASRTTFQDCWFQCLSEVPVDGVGIRSSGGLMSHLQVEGCSFKGPSLAMISIDAGQCEISACDFDNGRDIGDPGTDIAAGFATQRFWDLKPPAEKTLRSLVLTETHVRSRSPRHIWGDRRSQLPDSVVTMTGVVHSPKVTELAERPCSVEWVGVIGGGLLIQGCDLGSSVRCDGPDIVAVVASTIRGVPAFDEQTQRRVIDAAHVR